MSMLLMGRENSFVNDAMITFHPYDFATVGQILKLNADEEQTSAITNLSCLLYLQFVQVSCI